MADTVLLTGIRHETMPENYIRPANEMPRLSEVVTEEIPLIDLGGDDRSQIIRQIVEARRSYGFFQIINHGISEESIQKMMGMAEMMVGDRVVNVPGNQVVVLSKPSVGEIKDMKLDQKDIFKVAIPSVTVSAAEIIGDHAVGLSLDPYHDFLLKAYAVVNFAIFGMGMGLLFLSLLLPRAPAVVSVAKKLMSLVVALVYIAHALKMTIHAI